MLRESKINYLSGKLQITLSAEQKKGKTAGSTTIRNQTSDLKASQSALPAGQRKTFGQTFREDSNLILSTITIKCSCSGVERENYG